VDNRFSFGDFKKREFENGLVLITHLRVLSKRLIPSSISKRKMVMVDNTRFFCRGSSPEKQV